MGRVLLTEVKTEHVLDIEVPTSDGMVKNVDQPKEFQIVATVEVASNTDVAQYLTFERAKGGGEILRMTPEACCKKHCSKLRGLEHVGVTDGKSLVKFSPRTKTINNIVAAIFRIACGMEKSDDENEGEE
jgi:hypothetical protein